MPLSVPTNSNISQSSLPSEKQTYFGGSIRGSLGHHSVNKKCCDPTCWIVTGIFLCIFCVIFAASAGITKTPGLAAPALITGLAGVIILIRFRGSCTFTVFRRRPRIIVKNHYSNTYHPR